MTPITHISSICYRPSAIVLFFFLSIKIYSQIQIGARATLVIHGVTDPFTNITVKGHDPKHIVASSKSLTDGKFMLELPFVINTPGESITVGHQLYGIFFSNPLKKEGLVAVTIGSDIIPFSKKYDVEGEVVVLLKQKDSLKKIGDPWTEDDRFGSIAWNKEKRSFVYSIKNAHEEKAKDLTLKAGQPITLQNILFEPNKSTLQKSTFEELNKLVGYLNENKNAIIEISGHTDNSGNKDANLKLSKDRANTVRDYLIKKGIDGNRINAKGYGDAKPIALNDTEEGKQKNRRIEVRLIQ